MPTTRRPGREEPFPAEHLKGREEPFPAEHPKGREEEDTERLERLGIRIAEFIGSFIWGRRFGYGYTMGIQE